MLGALVLVLDPGLCRRVEEFQREFAHPFDHGHQPSLKAAPEHFLFPILLRGVREGGLVHDAQRMQAASELFGHHRGAIVGHQRARQTAAL